MIARFLFIVALTLPYTAQALDAFEIQVYNGDIDPVGESSLEIHLNTVPAGKTEPEWPGQIPLHHLSHLTFEFAHGVTRYWEVGAYFQTAMEANGRGHYSGTKLRSKWVRPRTGNDPYHLGLNMEISKIPVEFEEDAWGMEFRPIAGIESGPFLLLFNPMLGVALDAKKLAHPEFDPGLKASYTLYSHYAVGLEYYADLGELDAIPAIEKQQHYVYAAFDLVDTPLEFNFAVGRGLTAISNDWTVKTIFGFQL